VGAYIDQVVKNLLAKRTWLQKIREAQLADHTHKSWSIVDMVGHTHLRLKDPVKKYVPVKGKLSVCDNILMQNSQSVIPPSLQDDHKLLKMLHAGHQGISRQRASQVI